jgi:hypothetical protein
MRTVITLKNAVLVYFVAKAWNHAWKIWMCSKHVKGGEQEHSIIHDTTSQILYMVTVTVERSNLCWKCKCITEQQGTEPFTKEESQWMLSWKELSEEEKLFTILE